MMKPKDLTTTDLTSIAKNVLDIVEHNKQIFELVQNPLHWKEPTIPAIVKGMGNARLLADAIIFFVGGAEIETVRIKNGLAVEGYRTGIFQVTSKGYYHYIGA